MKNKAIKQFLRAALGEGGQPVSAGGPPLRDLRGLHFGDGEGQGESRYYAAAVREAGQPVGVGVRPPAVSKSEAGQRRIPHATSSQPPTTGGVTKLEAVRQALESLGVSAKPRTLDEYIRQRFGIVIPHNMISSYKCVLKAQAKSRRRPKLRSRVGEPQAASGPARPPVTPLELQVAKSLSGDVTLEDLEFIKGLARRLGRAKLQQLVEVLS
jgi:hypothetical protein